MEIILRNGDLVGIGENEAEVIKLLLRTVKTRGGVGIITDEGESFDISYDDPATHRPLIKRNRSKRKPLASGKKWTALEVDLLAQMFDDGKPLGEIAAMLERTVLGIAGQLRNMGLINPNRVRGVRDFSTRSDLGCRDCGRAVELMKQPDPAPEPDAPYTRPALVDLLADWEPEYVPNERKAEWLGFHR